MTNFTQQLQNKIDLKTKPLGALGTLEDLAFQIGNIQNSLTPKLVNPTLLTFAADHGITAEGVSAYPAEVTPQMVFNFIRGGAAINILCKQHDIDLHVIDAGVNYDFEDIPAILHAKAGMGTKNMLQEPAMSKEQLAFCIQKGEEIASTYLNDGCNIMGFGEMGIGNTSSAALIMSSMLDLPIEQCTGRGTGLDDAGLEQKITTLRKIKERYPNSTTPEEVLQNMGGFEIAQIASAMRTAYKYGAIVLIDGFIATAAYAIARAWEPKIEDSSIFCHTSHETGHSKFLDKLNKKAILNLNLRLGEGTGCALAYPIIESAVRFLNDMASFEEAGVSNKE